VLHPYRLRITSLPLERRTRAQANNERGGREGGAGGRRGLGDPRWPLIKTGLSRIQCACTSRDQAWRTLTYPVPILLFSLYFPAVRQCTLRVCWIASMPMLQL
jgi:hypothetical protein